METGRVDYPPLQREERLPLSGGIEWEPGSGYTVHRPMTVPAYLSRDLLGVYLPYLPYLGRKRDGRGWRDLAVVGLCELRKSSMVKRCIQFRFDTDTMNGCLVCL